MGAKSNMLYRAVHVEFLTLPLAMYWLPFKHELRHILQLQMGKGKSLPSHCFGSPQLFCQLMHWVPHHSNDSVRWCTLQTFLSMNNQNRALVAGAIEFIRYRGMSSSGLGRKRIGGKGGREWDGWRQTDCCCRGGGGGNITVASSSFRVRAAPLTPTDQSLFALSSVNCMFRFRSS